MVVVSVLSVFIFAESVAFDPTTGELVKNANCDQYISQINQIAKQQNEWPSTIPGSEEAKNIDKQAQKLTDQALEAQKKAIDKGCEPDPAWGVHGGKFNPTKSATNDQYQYVPASAAESGVPMNFDFIGLIGGMLGGILGGAGDIFPAIKEVATGAAGAAGGGS